MPTLGPATPSGLPSLRTIGNDITIGFRFLGSDAALRTFAALSLSFNFFGLMAGAARIPFLKRSFGASDLVVGYVFGLMAVGSIFGSWFAGRVPRSWPFGRIIIVAYAADGIAFIPAMFTHKLAIAVAFLTITDAFVLFEVAQIVGWRMRIVPEALVGRVFGVARLLALVGTVPGALLGGVLADHFGARTPIIAARVRVPRGRLRLAAHRLYRSAPTADRGRDARSARRRRSADRSGGASRGGG